MLRRPTSSAERSASSAAAGSRRSTWRALVTWSITAASPCPTKSWTSRAIRRRSTSSACCASSRRVAWSSATSSPWRAAARPKTHGKAMPRIQMPTAISDGSWITPAATGAEHREQAERDGAAVDERPAPDDEREQRDLEQQRLELSRPLRRDGRDDHRERERRQRQARHVGPHDERRRRDRAQARDPPRMTDRRPRRRPRPRPRTPGSAPAPARPATTPETTRRTHLEGTATPGIATPPTDGHATSDHGGGAPQLSPSPIGKAATAQACGGLQARLEPARGSGGGAAAAVGGARGAVQGRHVRGRPVAHRSVGLTCTTTAEGRRPSSAALRRV